MRCRAIQQPCTFFLYEPTLLQHSFVRVQTRFTSLQQLIRWSEWAFTSLQQRIRWSERAFLKGLRVGKDHFHVFGTHAVQQSAHLLLGILLCELQVLA